MRIERIAITNFRGLAAVEVRFDDVTTLIGPNGIGKSTVLRALDWFFNGTSPLSRDDIHSGAGHEAEAVVEVAFCGLSELDRNVLTKLGLGIGSAWTARRCSAPGVDVFSANCDRFADFDGVRAASSAAEQRTAYKELRASRPDLGLPAANSQAAVAAALTEWEADHPDRLSVGSVEISAPFNFDGGAPFSGIFDYVLVDADLRAQQESTDGRSTIAGRILSRSIDRGPVRQAFERLARDSSLQHDRIVAEHLTPALDGLSSALTGELNQLTRGRAIRLQATSPPMRPVAADVEVLIDDHGTTTPVAHQGHGFQRALLISALKYLATTSTGAVSARTVVMAIEEPELFQHPTQARVFARTLRELGLDGAKGFQVVYATHSPYFVEPAYFDQVRRLTAGSPSGTAPRNVEVHQVSLENVAARLNGLVDATGIRSRWDPMCARNLAEALFADAVVLVEGSGDEGVIVGVAQRDGGDLLADVGIAVTDAHGKDGLLTPLAILDGLGIPTLVVFDNDSGLAGRKAGKGEEYVSAAVANNAESNKRILRYLGLDDSTDLPSGRLSERAFALEDTLETVLASWSEWDSARKALIKEGRGAPGKNAATYALATRLADGDPPPALIEIVTAARALLGASSAIKTNGPIQSGPTNEE